MRADRPSLTASVVSFARGVVSRNKESPCYDPLAKALLPSPWRHFLSAVDRAGPLRPVAEGIARGALVGMAGHIELRTALLDDAVRAGVEAGARQLVILGAGLDARALRLASLADVDVYEVDHPATQARKQRRVAGMAPRARSLTFVPVDFAERSLEDGLALTAHDPAKPTFWLWEGVTMYLPKDATKATLRAVASRSAPGSRLGLTYLLPEIIAATALKGITGPLFRAISEPLVGVLTQEEMADLLQAEGFRVLEDLWPTEAASRYGARGLHGPFTPAERVVVAIALK